MNVFQKLAELRNLAREGAPVDVAELAGLEAAAHAESRSPTYVPKANRPAPKSRPHANTRPVKPRQHQPSARQ
jgi:hypothetical protein